MLTTIIISALIAAGFLLLAILTILGINPRDDLGINPREDD